MSEGARTPARLRALVVEDSPTQAILLRQRLARSGFEVQTAAHGVEALAIVERRLPSVILTDLDMPQMDGLELVKQLRQRGAAVPVILMTALGSEEIAVQALQAGASGYVPKRNMERDLARTMEQVLAMSRATSSRNQGGQLLDGFGCHYVLPNEPGLIAPLVRRLQRWLEQLHICAAADMVRIGMALREALMNAIEHGNLEMSSRLREEDEEQYYAMAAARRKQDPFRGRRVRVSAQQSRQGVTYMVADEGPGFDPSDCGDPTDPTNLDRVCGRGLLLIRSFMDEVSFSPSGNQITMVKRNPSPLVGS
jgi:CheY-like chemotaxis protein